jgi:four helix bundle protein
MYKLGDVEAYKTAFSLTNKVWSIVSNWSNFAKDTVGKQYVRAVDSISANIAEGFGRFGKKDKIRFYRYAKGSTYEAFDWTEKAFRRGLLTTEEYQEIFENLEKLPKLINTHIKYTDKNLSE